MQALDIVKFEENIKILIAKEKEEVQDAIEAIEEGRDDFETWNSFNGFQECTRDEYIKYHLFALNDDSEITNALIDKAGNDIDNDAINEDDRMDLREEYLIPKIEDAIGELIGKNNDKNDKKNDEILKSDKFKYLCAFVTEDGLMTHGKHIYCSKKTFSKIKHFLDHQPRRNFFHSDAYIDIISEYETLKESRIAAREEYEKYHEPKYHAEDRLFSGLHYFKSLKEET